MRAKGMGIEAATARMAGVVTILEAATARMVVAAIILAGEDDLLNQAAICAT
jgi:hypothetical protein